MPIPRWTYTSHDLEAAARVMQEKARAAHLVVNGCVKGAVFTWEPWAVTVRPDGAALLVNGKCNKCKRGVIADEAL